MVCFMQARTCVWAWGGKCLGYRLPAPQTRTKGNFQLVTVHMLAYWNVAPGTNSGTRCSIRGASYKEYKECWPVFTGTEPREPVWKE